jgi:ferredoxin
MVKIDENKCTGCGGCIDLCPPIAVSLVNDAAVVNDEVCTNCGICIKVCPMGAPYEVNQ